MLILLAAYGFEVGTAEAQLPGILLADVPVEGSGQVLGIQSTAQELGTALGVDVAQHEVIVAAVTDPRPCAEFLPVCRATSRHHE